MIPGAVQLIIAVSTDGEEVYLKTSGPLVPPVHFSIGPSSSRHLPHTCTLGSSQKQSNLGRSPASDCGALQKLQTSSVPTGKQTKQSKLKLIKYFIYGRLIWYHIKKSSALT